MLEELLIHNSSISALPASITVSVPSSFSGSLSRISLHSWAPKILEGFAISSLTDDSDGLQFEVAAPCSTSAYSPFAVFSVQSRSAKEADPCSPS